MKNAFLQGDLEEETYMKISPGFDRGTGLNKVYKLKNVFYGLKQLLRALFGRFTKMINGLGYKQVQGDHTLFTKHSETRGVTSLLVYIDNIIVTRDNEKEKLMLKQHLTKEFEIKKLGKLK